jgi:DNA-binding NarL/FixJ family response regulator
MDKSVRVFVVEDSVALRERIVGDIASLDRLDVVGWAESENHAVEAIEELSPDVVVTDLGLKEGSGVNLVRQVRAKRPALPPRIVVLTNYATPEYRARCLQYGADEFFDKTSEYDDFLAVMRKASRHPTIRRKAMALNSAGERHHRRSPCGSYRVGAASASIVSFVDAIA